MRSKQNFDAAKGVVRIYGDNREGNLGITNGDVFLEQYPRVLVVVFVVVVVVVVVFSKQ
jgi:hypothetical protein